MRFESVKPLEENHYRILDIDGKVINQEKLPNLTDDQLLYLYRTMLFSRTIDEKALPTKDKVGCLPCPKPRSRGPSRQCLCHGEGRLASASL